MRTILTAFLMILATQSGAKEIIMACDAYTFKYQKKIWSKARIQYRLNSAEWKQYCNGEKDHLYVSGLKVTCDNRHVLPDNPFFGLETVHFDEGKYSYDPNTSLLLKEFTPCKFLKK